MAGLTKVVLALAKAGGFTAGRRKARPNWVELSAMEPAIATGTRIITLISEIMDPKDVAP